MQIINIKTTDRRRIELGDIDQLAASIKRLGLLQPIRINRDNELIVGGRRLLAMQVNGLTELTEGVHFVYDDNTDTIHLREAELEENVRRKDMTWQEQVKSIAEIHTLRRLRSLDTNTKWMQEQTGALLGVDQSTVSLALKLVDAMGNPEVAKATSMRDAFSILLKEKEKETQAELAKRAATQIMPVQKAPPAIPGAGDIAALDAFLTGEDKTPVIVSQTLADRFVNADCLVWMKTQPDESVPHIITDPPYGIEMDNLTQANLDLVVDTHDVKENEDLHSKMLPEFYRILKPTGFCVMFCDIMQWQSLYDKAIAAGFAVQRWPVIWIKTHPCQNNAAGFNFTKNFELAIVLRKKDARLVSVQSTSFIPCSGLEGREKFSHPFVKPATLWKTIFRAVLQPGDWFLDPFMGEGSSVLAAMSMGIVPMGVELSPELYNKAIGHISNTALTTS